ncbi:reverse transcriptase domain-containing protein [Tanacetum coccineum]
MDDEPMWVADRVVALTLSSVITIPETANEFSIKGNPLNLIKGNQFDGITKTDPHKHIHKFLGICDMFKYRDTENEAVHLMMFPLLLTKEAKIWLDELNEETIEMWDEHRTAFISRFFPPALFDRLLGEIQAFSQHENESLTDAWLRMKEMLRNCHGHNVSKGNIIKIFYHGLDEVTQEVLNVAIGGIFLYKTSNQAYQLLKDKVLLKLDWVRMDAMTMKMDAQYKDFQSCSKPNLDDDDIPMSRLADKQSARPSGSLPSNTQPNPKGSSSKPYQPLRARNEENGSQYGKFLDMIRAVRINVPLVDILAGMSIYGKFLKELVSNKHKLEQISSAFLSDKSSAMIQNKVPPKLEDPRSFLIPCTFSKTFQCNALVDLGASINLMSYSLYAKLSLETLKPTKMSVRLADRSFQYPIGIDENMLVEVRKFTFPVDVVILEMIEDSKVSLILGDLFSIQSMK